MNNKGIKFSSLLFSSLAIFSLSAESAFANGLPVTPQCECNVSLKDSPSGGIYEVTCPWNRPYCWGTCEVSEGEVLVEPSPWESYKKKVKVTGGTCHSYKLEDLLGPELLQQLQQSEKELGK